MPQLGKLDIKNGREPRGLAPWTADYEQLANDTALAKDLVCAGSAAEVWPSEWLAREPGRNWGRSLVVAAIRGYQRWISPYKGFRCAHRQLHRGLSCSEFALRAILERGVVAALPGIRNQFRECGAAARLLREQRRAAQLSAADDEGYQLDRDYDADDALGKPDDRMITDRFYEESEKKRKRLQELKGGDRQYTDCPDWCFFSCGTCEFIEPYCCWTPW